MKITFRTDNQTATLLCPSVDSLYNINELLLVLQDPVQFVVVAGAKVAHHVLIPEEEHKGHWVVQLVHLFEVGYLIKVANIDDGKILDTICDTCAVKSTLKVSKHGESIRTIQNFILPHTVRIVVPPKSNDDKSFFLRHDCLIWSRNKI